MSICFMLLYRLFHEILLEITGISSGLIFIIKISTVLRRIFWSLKKAISFLAEKVHTTKKPLS